MGARHYFLLLALGLFCRKADAQALNGVIVDADGAPVAYANVYLPALATGDVTDPRGNFAFTAAQLTEASFTTPMTVSCIGFRDTTLSLGALRQNPRLVLAKAAYDLAEVEVRDTRLRYGKSKRMGVRALAIPGIVCMGGYHFQGLEYAVEVKTDATCRLENSSCRRGT